MGEGLENLFVHGDIYYAQIWEPEVGGQFLMETEADDNRGFAYFGEHHGMVYRRVLKDILESGDLLFVAYTPIGKPKDKRDKKLIGFVRYHLLDREESVSPMEVPSRNHYLLKTIEVHSSYRRKGIGRALAAISFMFLDGDIVTRPHNDTARRFFEDKMTFEKVDTHPNLGVIHHISRHSSRQMFRNIVASRPFVYLYDVMLSHDSHGAYRSPDGVSMLQSVGMIFSFMGKSEKAEIYLKAAISIAERQDNPVKLCELYLDMGRAYRVMRRNDGSLKFYMLARHISKAQNSPNLTVRALEGIGWAKWAMGDMKESLKYLNDALELSVENRFDPLTGTIYIDLGNCYGSMSRYEDAIEHFDIALTLLDKKRDRFSIARTENNIAHILIEMKKYDEAVEHLEVASKICHQTEGKYLMNVVNANIASCFIAQGHYKKALHHAMEGRAGFEEALNNMGIATMDSILGEIHFKLGDDDPEPYFARALVLFEQEEDPFQHAETLIRASRYYQGKGETGRATGLCNRAKEIGENIGSEHIIKACEEILG